MMGATLLQWWTLLYLIGVPTLYIINSVLYRRAFHSIMENRNKISKFLRISRVVSWVAPIVLIFAAYLIIVLMPLSNITTNILMIAFASLPLSILALNVIMLIYGLIKLSKLDFRNYELKRKWLLVAFFLPLIGSILYFKIGEQDISIKEIQEKMNVDEQNEEIKPIFKEEQKW